MDTPANIDDFLAGLLQQDSAENVAQRIDLDDEQRAFIERVIESVTTGSKSVFVLLHPDGRLQYMLLNTNRIAAISLLATVMDRTAEALEVDVDAD